MGLVRITSWYPNFNGSHFGLPPARSTEWLDCHPKLCELWLIRTDPYEENSASLQHHSSQKDQGIVKWGHKGNFSTGSFFAIIELKPRQTGRKSVNTVIHFYFGAGLISVILVQGVFTYINSLPKLQLRVDGCSWLFKFVWIPLVLPTLSVPKRWIFALLKIVRYLNKSGLQLAKRNGQLKECFEKNQFMCNIWAKKLIVLETYDIEMVAMATSCTVSFSRSMIFSLEIRIKWEELAWVRHSSTWKELDKDGDLAESIKCSTSDRLGDLVP